MNRSLSDLLLLRGILSRNLCVFARLGRILMRGTLAFVNKLRDMRLKWIRVTLFLLLSINRVRIYFTMRLQNLRLYTLLGIRQPAAADFNNCGVAYHLATGPADERVESFQNEGWTVRILVRISKYLIAICYCALFGLGGLAGSITKGPFGHLFNADKA